MVSDARPPTAMRYSSASVNCSMRARRSTNSAASNAFTVQATTLEISAASAGVRRPAATALMTTDMASAASRAVLIGGKGNATNRFLSGGQIRSMHSRSAIASPLRPIWMAFCVSASAWPSSRASHAKVALLREPFGRPLGLPDLPFWNRLPCFSTVSTGAMAYQTLGPRISDKSFGGQRGGGGCPGVGSRRYWNRLNAHISALAAHSRRKTETGWRWAPKPNPMPPANFS